MIEDSLIDVDTNNCQVKSLVLITSVAHAKKFDAKVIIRGLVIADFEYEFQMAGMNSKLGPMIETIFLMALKIPIDIS